MEKETKYGSKTLTSGFGCKIEIKDEKIDQAKIEGFFIGMGFTTIFIIVMYFLGKVI